MNRRQINRPGNRQVKLCGRWPLAPALQALAPRRGLAVVAESAATTAMLRWELNGYEHSLVLPDLAGIRHRIARRVVAALLASTTPRPRLITGTALVPASGTCEPARSGPVNAVLRLPPLAFRADDDAQVTLNVLQIQHSRCWLFALHLHGSRLRSADLHAHSPARPLPSRVCQDTAQAVDHLASVGEGMYWPGTYLLDLAPTGVGADLATLICSDALIVNDVLDEVVASVGEM